MSDAILICWRRYQIQGEHKNIPCFQVVIKSKLPGIFLQNWWLQLHNLIQFHVVSHTLNVPLSCSSTNRCDNLARTRLSAAYPAWPAWQLQWCVPVIHPRLRVVEVHKLCLARTPQRKKSQKVRSGDLGGHLQNTWSFCPARPIHLFGKWTLRDVRTARCQCGISIPIFIKIFL